MIVLLFNLFSYKCYVSVKMHILLEVKASRSLRFKLQKTPNTNQV